MPIGLRRSDVQDYLAQIDGNAQALYDQMVRDAAGRATVADTAFLVAYKGWLDAWRQFLEAARDVQEQDDLTTAIAHASKFATELDGNPDTGTDGWRQRYERSRGMKATSPVLALVRSPIPTEMTETQNRGIRWYHVAAGVAALGGLWWLLSPSGDDEPSESEDEPDEPAKPAAPTEDTTSATEEK